LNFNDFGKRIPQKQKPIGMSSFLGQDVPKFPIWLRSPKAYTSIVVASFNGLRVASIMASSRQQTDSFKLPNDRQEDTA